MQIQPPWIRATVLIGSVAVLLLCYAVIVRPWYLNWGATEQERQMALPGDEIVPDPVSQQTRAITVQAGAATVWRWLSQTGRDRGGFYSFDLLENIVGCEMPTSDTLRPDKQNWNLGDKLWMYPANKAGGTGYATLRSMVPGRALGFGSRRFFTPLTLPEDGSWSFCVQPITPESSRLLFRGRASAQRSLTSLVFDRFFFDPVHYMMERRMMLGLKQLAEGGDRGRLWNHVQVVLFASAFVLMIAFAIQLLQSEQWQRPLGGFVAAAIVFQILTLCQPPVLLDLALLAAVGSVLCRPTPHQRAEKRSSTP